MRASLLNQITRLDQQGMVWLQKWRTSGLTAIMKVLTHSGSGSVWIGSAAVLVLLTILKIEILPEQASFVRSMGCALIAWWIGSKVKKKINRPRPQDTIDGFRAAIKAPKCQSFPSSHTSSATALFVALMLNYHPLAGVVGGWALIVSFSRIYLGVHFFTDVFGGVAMGTFCGFFVLLINRGLG